MPRVVWPLEQDRPIVRLSLTAPNNGRGAERTLLADTGAGPASAPFSLVLRDSDCRAFGLTTSRDVGLGGAYSGAFNSYVVSVELPALQFADDVIAVAVPDGETPPGLDGIAAFRLLDRFGYGNFGVPRQFGPER